MTRSDYLSLHWKGYIQPPAELLNHSDWVWGKIIALSESWIQLGPSQERFPVVKTENHEALGKSASLSVLQVGDCVGYSRSQGCCYLLSPCQTPLMTSTDQQQWQIFLETVRRYFTENGFRHWTTPTLLASSGIDAHIDFFTAKGVRSGRQYALPTSPEFALKKAMAQGETHLFEIRSCFRDDDRSPTHKAEFTMIEWYRGYADKWTLLDDFLGLIKYVIHQMKLPIKAPQKVTRYTIAEIFQEVFGVRLTPQSSSEDLRQLLKEKGWHTHDQDDWDDLFFRLYMDGVEPQLKEQVDPVVLAHFPLSQGSLSRQTPDGWADRFEIYWQGIELANAYQEEHNPEKMRARYQSELQKRTGLDRVPHVLDEDFLKAMESGFPPSAGIALGLDRLWMILTNKSSI